MRVFSNGIERSLIVFVLLALPTLTNAQAVTYDFTGTVTRSSGIYASETSTGAYISGTYTIDVAAGNPFQSTGTVGGPNAWDSLTYGGQAIYRGNPTPSSLVFSSTLNSGGLTYASITPSSLGSYSAVAGCCGGTYYEGLDSEFSSSSDVQSIFEFDNGIPGAYDANGLPVFQKGGFGVLANSQDNSDVFYSIKSLTVAPTTLAAPEIDPASCASGLTMLVGGLIVFRGRRSKAQFPASAV